MRDPGYQRADRAGCPAIRDAGLPGRYRLLAPIIFAPRSRSAVKATPCFIAKRPGGQGGARRFCLRGSTLPRAGALALVFARLQNLMPALHQFGDIVVARGDLHHLAPSRTGADALRLRARFLGAVAPILRIVQVLHQRHSAERAGIPALRRDLPTVPGRGPNFSRISQAAIFTLSPAAPSGVTRRRSCVRLLKIAAQKKCSSSGALGGSAPQHHLGVAPRPLGEHVVTLRHQEVGPFVIRIDRRERLGARLGRQPAIVRFTLRKQTLTPSTVQQRRRVIDTSLAAL